MRGRVYVKGLSNVWSSGRGKLGYYKIGPTSFRMAKIGKVDNTDHWQECAAFSYSANGNVK